MSRALVLGSGEATGFAWSWGVLTGLHDSGIDLMDADLIVGTSAGAAAAVNLTTGAPHWMFDWIMTDTERERNAAPTAEAFIQMLMQAIGNHPGDATAILADIGSAAMQAGGASTERMREIVLETLRVQEWPEKPLMIPAIDAATGELSVFTRDSGVSVVDAVCASVALPGVWAPYALGGKHYIDGSTRSSINADLAAGHDRVLVVASVNGIRGIPGASIDEGLEPVRAKGEAFLIKPTKEAKQAMGQDMFDMSKRPVALRAGYAHAEAVAPALKEFWLG